MPVGSQSPIDYAITATLNTLLLTYRLGISLMNSLLVWTVNRIQLSADSLLWRMCPNVIWSLWRHPSLQKIFRSSAYRFICSRFHLSGPLSHHIVSSWSYRIGPAASYVDCSQTHIFLTVISTWSNIQGCSVGCCHMTVFVMAVPENQKRGGRLV